MGESRHRKNKNKTGGIANIGGVKKTFKFIKITLAITLLSLALGFLIELLLSCDFMQTGAPHYPIASYSAPFAVLSAIALKIYND